VFDQHLLLLLISFPFLLLFGLSRHLDFLQDLLDVSVFLCGLNAVPLCEDDLVYLFGWGCRVLLEDLRSKIIGEILEDE
jgi:hypothetical protein